jgi:hypothetical protein
MIVPYFQGLARAARLARHSPPVPSLG